MPISHVSWRPLDRPHSAANLRPASAGHHEEEQLPIPTKLRLLNPLHAGIPTSPDSRLRSVVEALFHVHYHAGISSEHGDGMPSDTEPSPLDLRTVEGIRSYLRSEPSLVWAVPHASQCLRLLRKRSGANHAEAAKMPAISGGHGGAIAPLGMRRSRSAASRLCGGGRLPPMGGGGALCAASLLSSNSAPSPPSWEASSKLAGVDWEIAVVLADRLLGLASGSESTAAWLLIETCRDCANHGTCFRHDERAFQKRYAQMHAAINKVFPGAVVELLVPPGRSAGRSRSVRPPLRIGAFEIFLCCPEPLVPFGAISLPTLSDEEHAHIRHAGEDELTSAEVESLSKKLYSAVCVSSKLATLKWPDLEATLIRLATAMPRTPISVHVQTAAGLPVPSVRLKVSPCHEVFQDIGDDRDAAGRPGGSRLTVQGQTDVSGWCRLLVPVCLQLEVRAWHELLMHAQEHVVTIPSTAPPPDQVFVAETVVQLWQAELKNELVVYRFSPRAQICSAPLGGKPGIKGTKNAAQREVQEELAVRTAFAAYPDLEVGVGLRPFKGHLETSSGVILQPNVRGYFRGGPQLFDDIVSIECAGWRPAEVPAVASDTAASDRPIVELARLGVPRIEVHILASCCGAPLPKAHISIDGEEFGCTSEAGDPVLCGVRCGERQIQVQHSLVAKGFTIPVNVADSTTRSVHARMPLEGLHFVCVARSSGSASLATKARGDLSPLSPSFRKRGDMVPRSADLWLVGGSLAKWKSSRGGPASGREVSLWNGEFRGHVPEDEGAFIVEGGVITKAAVHDSLDTTAHSVCCLSQAIGLPVSCSQSKMQPLLHPAAGPSGCAMCLMSKMVDSGTPALWVGRLEGEPEDSRRSFRRSGTRANVGTRRRQLVLRTTCCQRGFLGASATVDEAPVLFNDGVVDLPWEGGDASYRVRLDAIPECLMPGRCSDYMVHCSETSPESMDLDIACTFWIYWCPPEPEEDDDEEWSGESPEGLIWITANSEHLPDDALPVEGVLECPCAEEAEIVFDGSTKGPFTLCPAPNIAVIAEADGNAPCLLAGLKFRAKPPHGYYHKAREPSPLQERCAELGGCELPRLVNCPVAIGAYKVTQPPPLNLKLSTSCCGCGFVGARVVLKGHTSATIDETGAVELKRKCDSSCSALQVNVEGVPKCLLPGCSLDQEVKCGPFDAASMDLEVSCTLWAYWIPPREEELAPTMKDEAADEAKISEDDVEDDGGEAEPDPLLGKLFIAADSEHVPKEAMAISGVLRCPGSKQVAMILDGTSIGPFRLDAAPELSADTTSGEKPCLLAGVTIEVRQEEGLEYHAASPPPLAGSIGCLVQYLAQMPLSMGHFTLQKPPPLKLSLFSGCCCRGFPGNVVLKQHDQAVAEAEVDEKGCVELQRKRDRTCKELQVQVSNVPMCLLPNGKSLHKLTCGPFEDVSINLDVAAFLWVYWIPPDEEDDQEDVDAAPPQGFIFVTSDKEQVPDEARPVLGVLMCHGAENVQVLLQGQSLGPFAVKVPRRARDTLKKRRISPPDAEKPDDAVESDTSWPPCLLAGIEFHMKPPRGYTFTAKKPSPLAERNGEIGGCELHRIAQCPTVVGYFTAILPPPVSISLCTSCCGRGFAGTQVKLHGGQQKAEATVAEDGQIKLRRRRDPTCKQLQFQVDNIPSCLLPGASRQITVDCEPFKPVDLGWDIPCYLWIYKTFPEEEDVADEEEDSEGAGEAPEGMLWVATDVETVPEEAQCVRGQLRCRGSQPASVALTGVSMGPFQLQRPPPDEDDHGPQRCLLANLELDVEPPEGFTFRARDPSPFADRVGELGGCEMQRITGCPVVCGYFEPMPAKPVQLCMRTSCCGCAFAGASIVVDGKTKSVNESGTLEIPRKRDPATQTTLQFQVEDVPVCLLPGSSSQQSVTGSIFEPLPAPLEVSCNLWIYWVPPEEEEEEDEPMEAMVWVAADVEHLPEDAMPIAGVIQCPGTEMPEIALDGLSKGPFLLRNSSVSTADARAEGIPDAADAAAAGDEAGSLQLKSHCIISGLSLKVLPPDGYTYRARDPSPFFERCEELGGCELQRLVKCPTVFGYLKPEPSAR